MKPGAALRVLNPRPAFFMQLGDLAATRFIDGEEDAQGVMVVLVVTDRARLDGVLPDAIARLATPAGSGSRGRRSSGVPTDLDESYTRDRGLAAGVVDNEVCAIDETWSALCFVHRLRDRFVHRLRDRPARNAADPRWR